MKKLIDKDAALEAIEKFAEEELASANHNYLAGLQDAAELINNLPEVQTCVISEGLAEMDQGKYGDLMAMLQYIIRSIEFRNSMDHIHNCNDCGAPKGCMYRPAWGQLVRWNCPHWKEKSDLTGREKE